MEGKYTKELNELMRTHRKHRQWADDTINFVTGCGNQCRYCYSCEMATRFHRRDPANWGNEIIRQKDVDKKIKKYPKMVMFPSSHDIRPSNLLPAVQVLNNILSAGNEVLVTSKPNYECIKKICETFINYKDKILFRFTIGSTESAVLRFWETNAPTFEERYASLKLAYNMGYQISVSAEPLLDKDVKSLINTLSPHITDTIWIGKAEQLCKRLVMNGYNDPETISKANDLIKWQNDPSFIRSLYETYKDNPMIRWKTSYLEEMAKIEQTLHEN
jgi:DNA repair photolyase